MITAGTDTSLPRPFRAPRGWAPAEKKNAIASDTKFAEAQKSAANDMSSAVAWETLARKMPRQDKNRIEAQRKRVRF